MPSIYARTYQHDAGEGTGRRLTQGRDGREGGASSSGGWATAAATIIFSASSRTRACVCVGVASYYGHMMG